MSEYERLFFSPWLRHLRQLAIGTVLVAVAIPSYPTTCVKDERRAPVKAVCGQVHDPNDVSLPGATVSLIRGDGSVLATRTADAAGKFDFSPVPHGDYLLRVDQRGFATEERNITVTREQVKRCKSTVSVQLGAGICTGSIRVKGFDK